MNKFQDVIDRVEEVRVDLRLNKSRFSNSIGMKPQTYNNFVGLQASKPNIDLLKGVVNAFNVNPMWLINGIGKKYMHTDLRYPDTSVGAGAMAVSENPADYITDSEGLKSIQSGFEELKSILKVMDNRISRLESN